MNTPPDKRWREVTEGEQIRASTFRLVLFLAVTGGGGLAMIAAYYSIQQQVGEAGRRDRGPYAWLFPIGGGAMLLYGAGKILWAWYKDERLVIGDDRLQLLQFGQVVGEAPYANLAELTVLRMPKGEPILLAGLVDSGRADWFWPNPFGFHEYLQQSTSHDIMLTHEIGFTDSAATLRDKIQERLDAWRADPGEKP